MVSVNGINNIKDSVHQQFILQMIKQACKSSEDTQVAGYARFEKVLAGQEEEDIFASRQFTTLIAFYGCLDVLPVHAL